MLLQPPQTFSPAPDCSASPTRVRGHWEKGKGAHSCQFIPHLQAASVHAFKTKGFFWFEVLVLLL